MCVNLNDLPEIHDSLRKLELLFRRLFEEMDEYELALGGILLLEGEQLDKRSLQAVEMILRSTRGTSSDQVADDGQHPIAISFPVPTDGAGGPSVTFLGWTGSRELDPVASTLKSWWNEACGTEPGSDRAPENETLRIWRPNEKPISRRQANRPVTGWASLTDAEVRVAELVSLGLTNREIGQHMFLSRHTIDSHLRHAYEKLGIRSRVQLARVALEQATPRSA